ncbi:chromosome segregation protein ScpA [Serinicoccus chungangensis]|uniref:Segregation and condensation protein A n=1 Tax=Serinicoccus chungangensis TaxID=767452 RepID=A0A0W8I755_9MICO|nr:segregation/condensation protein A [Serinicoccus chungangensis]KUG54432.1 chromosome segregation protein ScpA [Serinicoccus chungangensis]
MPPATSARPETPGGVLVSGRAGFEVHLDVFSGPFELLLGLIAKHRLDVTEIALARVTDEFVAYLRAAQEGEGEWDLSQASEFVLIAATLLDLKAARLLPSAREDDEEDLALIEARDLLFARLLQYRAFKQVADELRLQMEGKGRIFARDVGVEERFASLLPELVLTITPEQLAMIAGRAMIPKPPPTVGVEHLHAAQVSVREQASIVVSRLRARGSASFRELVADADSTLVIVARFLSLLELFRDTVVALEQDEALGELTVRWTGPEGGDVAAVGAEFDEQPDEEVADEPTR